MSSSAAMLSSLGHHIAALELRLSRIDARMLPDDREAVLGHLGNARDGLMSARGYIENAKKELLDRHENRMTDS